ncbi:acyl-CoA dehydrogenase/oxidase, partial [Parachaetomium inaequale]
MRRFMILQTARLPRHTRIDPSQYNDGGLLDHSASSSHVDSRLHRNTAHSPNAVAQVCSRFPNTYWQERDQQEQDPTDFHAALAKDSWLGIALPEALGGSGLGISEATVMMQTIDESGAGMEGAQSIHANVYATQPLARFGYF